MKRIFLTALLMICFGAQVKATNYYVDGNNGSNTAGDGAQVKPWQSITFALSQINTDMEMHNIYVMAAVYDTTIETFPITIKNQVSLIGAGQDVTILDAQNKETVIFCKDVTDASTTIEGFTITNGRSKNTESSRGWRGSAILIDNSSLAIINNKITNNAGGWSGGAIMCDGGTATIENNIIINNEDYGIKTNGNVLIQNNIIEGHTDAGIECSCSPMIRNNTIRKNHYGINSDFGAIPTIEANTIYENDYGIYTDYEKIIVKYNTISFNTKDGVFVRKIAGHGPGPVLINNTIDSNGENGINLSTYYSNVGIFLIKNNIISNNTEYGIKEKVQLSYTTEIQSMRYNLFYNNGAGVYLYNGTDSYSDVNAMDSAIDACQFNIAGDPLFVNVLDINYHLRPGSLAINAGDPNSPVDLDGSRADIGALPSFDPSGPPLMPKNLRAIPGHAKINLSWSPNLEPDLSYYCIYRSIMSNFEPFSADSIDRIAKPDTVYCDPNLQIGTTYYYRICAVDSTNKKSTFTPQVSATPLFNPNFLTVLKPDDGIFVNQTPVTVTGLAVTPYLTKVSVNDIIVPIVNDSFKVDIDLVERLNEITVVGFDESNIAVLERKIKIKLDSILPQLKITSPTSNQTFSYSPIQIKGRLIESNLISLKINNNTPDISGNLFSLGANLGDGIEINEGDNWIKAIAVDSAGNCGRDSILIIGTPPSPKRLYLKNDALSWFPYPPYSASTTQGYSHTFILDQQSWKFPLTGDIKGSKFTVVLLAGCYGLGSAEMKGELFLRHQGSDEILASTPQFSGKMAGYSPFGYQTPTRKSFNISGKDPNSVEGDTLIFKVTKVGGDRAGLIFTRELNMGHSYIQLPQITKVEEIALTDLPLEFALDQNYPNPFNPETTINYQLPEKAEVTLKIYNITGQLVNTLVQKEQAAGVYTFTWNGRDISGNPVPSGVYFYQVQAVAVGSGKGFGETRKMVLVR